MNVFSIFMISIAIYSCYNHVVRAEYHQESLNKASRELETFTTIILDDEAYSLASVAKPPKNISKTIGQSRHHLKGSKLKQQNNTRIKPNFRLSLSKGDKFHQEEIHSGKHDRNQSSHSSSKFKRLKKKVYKRHFGVEKRNYRKTRQQQENAFNQTYSFATPYSVSNMANDSFRSVVSKGELPMAPAIFDVKSTTGSFNDQWQKFDQNPWAKTNYSNSETGPYNPLYKSSTSSGLKSSSSKTETFLSPPVNQNYGNSTLYGNNKLGFYENSMKPSGEVANPYVESTPSWKPPTTVSPFVSKVIQRAAVVQRNLPVTSHQPKSEKDEDVPTDESEPDGTVVSFGGTCDQSIHQTCWMQREVGDVLTLSVKINSSKKPDSFQIRWMKVYHIYESKKGKPIEIEPTKLPWNMVSGSEGRELRLNPVTNTDMEPNCIVAKVFFLTKHRGKTLFTQLKKLIFRIDSPIIDMGKIYAGEELSINIENFISVPERGNLLFDWCLESKPHQYDPLPSNIKVSNSGRSVILKELKKGRLGVLNCVIYSSNRFAVAKRRFNILNVAENVKRRSTAVTVKNTTEMSDLQRRRRCRHVIRRSREKTIQRIEEGQKPKSRKKRVERMGSDRKLQEKTDCEHLRQKVYSRWVRSLFGEFTTEDPKLMPLEKLLELSEQGDGTLDDEIPHEVHYVKAEVRSLPGTSVERPRQLLTSANCTSDDDCGKDAICVETEKQTDVSDRKGYCNCRPEFYGDGFTCHKIPLSNHREKRLRRSVNKDFQIPKHLFYEHSKDMVTVPSPEIPEETQNSEIQPKILAFEEEESFLLSSCIDEKDCSTHASCIQPSNGHPYCQCRPGYRGNGIFCWEIIDYVPPEEHFLPEDEVNPRGPTLSSDLLMDRPASGTTVSDELLEEEEDNKKGI